MIAYQLQQWMFISHLYSATICNVPEIYLNLLTIMNLKNIPLHVLKSQNDVLKIY